MGVTLGYDFVQKTCRVLYKKFIRVLPRIHRKMKSLKYNQIEYDRGKYMVLDPGPIKKLHFIICDNWITRQTIFDCMILRMRVFGNKITIDNIKDCRDTNFGFVDDLYFNDFRSEHSHMRKILDWACRYALASKSKEDIDDALLEVNTDIKDLGNFDPLQIGVDGFIYPDSPSENETAVLLCAILAFSRIVIGYDMPLVINGSWLKRLDAKTRYNLFGFFATYFSQCIVITSEDMLKAQAYDGAYDTLYNILQDEEGVGPSYIIKRVRPEQYSQR